MNKFALISLCAILFVIFSAVVSYSEDFPIPEDAEIIVMARPAVILNDSIISDISPGVAFFKAIITGAGIELDQVKDMVFFTPFDTAWQQVYNPHRFENLAPRAAILIRGSFDARSIIKNLRSRKWEEKDFPGRKFLWWSASGTYWYNPRNNLCATEIIGYGIAIGGSDQIIKDLMDIKIMKKNAFRREGIYRKIQDSFYSDTSCAIAAFGILSPPLRTVIKEQFLPEAAKAKSFAVLIEKIDQINEVGFVINRQNNQASLSLILGTADENTSMFIAGFIQIAGSVGGMVSDQYPLAAILDKLRVSRSHNDVKIDLIITRDMLQNSRRP